MNVRRDHVTVFVARPSAASHELLQLRRTPGDYLGGTWQTVRGSSESDETAIETALRELREETGLTPVEFYSLGIVESFFIAKLDTLWHSPAFIAIVAPDAPITLDAEHDAFRWIALADADERFMWASERPLLDVIRRVILGEAHHPAKEHLAIPLPRND